MQKRAIRPATVAAAGASQPAVLKLPVKDGYVARHRYEKYDKPMGKRRETSGEDPFQDEYETVEAIVEDLMRVSWPSACRAYKCPR